MRYSVVLFPVHDDSDGYEGFAAHVPILPGCFGQGATVAEALANAKEAVEAYLAGSVADDEFIPTESEPALLFGIDVAMPAPEQAAQAVALAQASQAATERDHTFMSAELHTVEVALPTVE